MSTAVTEKSYPRKFVPADADMGDWAQIEPLFDQLDQVPLTSTEDLEGWLGYVSELASCLSEENSKRYVAMTCQTDDPEREKAYMHFVENIEPKCEPRWHKLKERYVAAPARTDLSKERYTVYDRSVRNDVELFREENIPLKTEDTKLDQKYMKTCGVMTVTYEGEKRTLQQMARYQQEPDRAVREKTWTMVARRRLEDREAIDEIFDQMITIRTQIAENAGFENFRDYQFRRYERFDYTPDDCFAFHEAIEELIVPAMRIIQGERRQSLGVEKLRPWDLAVDVKNRAPLRPFDKAEDLRDKCETIFAKIDPELGTQFHAMVEAGWLDLESREGKAPGGYQATFDETRHPFIFMNAVGLHRDVETLLHEGGHAFHAVACRDEPLVSYRHCGMEMAEVASMGMELLAYDHLDVFYDGEDLHRARREQLEGIVNVFPWIATIDAYQHWLYLHPTHTREARTAHWLSLNERFGGIVDYEGHEDARRAMWQRQLHLFGVPFYYIEYGIAQIGALQLWRNARQDKAQALKQYREALALGGSRPLPELWSAAGLTFDFSKATLAPLIEDLMAELDKLN